MADPPRRPTNAVPVWDKRERVNYVVSLFIGAASEAIKSDKEF